MIAALRHRRDGVVKSVGCLVRNGPVPLRYVAWAVPLAGSLPALGALAI